MPIRPENRNRYPDNWAEISNQIKFDRAGGRCECEGECGRGTHRGRCPNRHRGTAYDSGVIVVLTTAHLNHVPEDVRPENLKAMCAGCHLHYDRDHHAETARRTRFFERATWMDQLPDPMLTVSAAELATATTAPSVLPGCPTTPASRQPGSSHQQGRTDR